MTVASSTRQRFKKKTQCRSCKHDTGGGCKVLTDSRDVTLTMSVDSWQQNWVWQTTTGIGSYPSVDAEGCPGWEQHEEV